MQWGTRQQKGKEAGAGLGDTMGGQQAKGKEC